MWKEIKFVLYTWLMNIRNAAELRTSFGMQIIGMAITDLAFIIMWVLFLKQVGGIGGWVPMDAVGLLGFSAFSFGIVSTFFDGIRRIPGRVANGGFDRFLLSPKNVLLRAATADFGLAAVGDILFGIFALVVYAIWTHIPPEGISMMLCGAFCASLATFGTLLLSQSMAFFFFDNELLTNGLLESFITPSLFAGGAFQGPMRLFFTFVIPALVVGTLPVEAVKSLSWSHMLSIFILSVFFFALSNWVFYKGIRRYEGSSIGGFGS
jgi:ABC-2 type transport system permease protein